MSTPHLCPRCHGERVVDVFEPVTASSTPRTRPCPTCRGEGVLWESSPLRSAEEPFRDAERWGVASTSTVYLRLGDLEQMRRDGLLSYTVDKT